MNRTEPILLTTEELTGESLLFGLTGQALYRYADREWLNSLASLEVFEESPFAGNNPDAQAGLKELQAWTAENRGGLTDESLDEIRIDFTRLFAGGPGPVLAPPWESVYFSQDRLVFQHETLQVREWYSRFGLQVVNMYSEPDDHIGIELGFVAHLARLALESEELGDHDRAVGLVEAQRDFLTEHLLRWGPGWCQLVMDHAKTRFYHGVSHLAKGALEYTAVVLGIPLPPSSSLDHFKVGS